MYEILYMLILSGGLALFLALGGVLFEIFLFIIYKLDGGRLDLISYLKKL